MGKISFRTFKNFIKISRYEKRTLRKAFDANFYLYRYPDIAHSKINPLTHFIRYGWREGRWPRPDFDTNYYLENNPEIVTSGMNPFLHYLVVGKALGRAGNDSPGTVVCRDHRSAVKWCGILREQGNGERRKATQSGSTQRATETM